MTRPSPSAPGGSTAALAGAAPPAAPHATWSSADLSGRLAARFVDKLRCFAAGRPSPDIVDLAAGC